MRHGQKDRLIGKPAAVKAIASEMATRHGATRTANCTAAPTGGRIHYNFVIMRTTPCHPIIARL